MTVAAALSVHWALYRSSLVVLSRISIGLLTLLTLAAAHADPVAVVVRVTGDVQRIVAGEPPQDLSRRDVLDQGDRIRTGTDGEATLRFIDEGLVDLGTNSQLIIERYQNSAADDEPRVVLNLLEGKLRTLTGSLAQDPDDYDLRTPVASIGIRGTEFEVWQQAQSGTRVELHQGVVTLVNDEIGNPVILDTDNRFGIVAPGKPAERVTAAAGERLGPLPDALKALTLPGILPPLPGATAVPLPAGSGGARALDDDDSALERFIAMVETEDWPNARVMAGELRARYEGTPRFDLYYARVMLQQGRAQEAVFALERVLAFAPDQHRARLDLARAYFINNNLERSRAAFEQVLATNPPANVRNNINDFLARIDAAQRAQIQQFQMFAGLDVGYDTNINGGATLNEPLAPNLLGLTDLSDDSKAIDSSFGRFRVGSTWVRPTHLRAANIYSLQGFTTLYPGNSRYQQLGLNSQWRYRSNTDQSRQTLAINAGQLWLDTSPWQFSLNLSGEATYPVWDSVWLGPIASTSLSFAQQDGRNNSVRDALGLVATVEDAPRNHRFSSQYVQYSQSGTDNGYNEWRGLAQRYQLDWRWPNRLTTALVLEHQWHRYQADDRLFVEQGSSDNKRRSDQIVTIDASLTWVPEPWLTSRSGLRYDWRDSNINAYSRDQWVISQSLTLTF